MGLLALSKDSSPMPPHQRNTNVSCCLTLLETASQMRYDNALLSEVCHVIAAV